MLKLKNGGIFIKVFLKLIKWKLIKVILKIIKIVKTQKGEIFIKVFLKFIKWKLIKVILKIIKIVKTQNIYKSIFEIQKMKINKDYFKNH